MLGTDRRWAQAGRKLRIEDAKLFSDSSSALAVAAKPPGFIDERMRHVRTSYFFFRQQVNAGTLKLLKVRH